MVLIFASFFLGIIWGGGLASDDDLSRGQVNGCVSGVLIRASVIADNDLPTQMRNRSVVLRLPAYCYPLLTAEQPDALEFFYNVGGLPPRKADKDE